MLVPFLKSMVKDSRPFEWCINKLIRKILIRWWCVHVHLDKKKFSLLSQLARAGM